MPISLLGFDAALDSTAAATRKQFVERLFAATGVLLLSMRQLTGDQLTLWLSILVLGEVLLWIATARSIQARRRVLARALRLISSAIAASAWAVVASMWWLSGAGHGKAVALVVLCGVMLYVVRGCHRSLIHMISVATPLSAAFFVLPLYEPTLLARAEAFGAMTLLMVFTVSSGLGSWRAERALVEATGRLIEKQREAAAANTAKTEFLANMSHEIRTPLNGIVAMAHMLKTDELSDRQREAAELIATSGETLEALLSDILDMAKIEAGEVTMENSAFHVGELVRGVAGLLRLKAEEKGVALRVEIDEEAEGFVIGDPVRVRQVLTNLVSNAVKFTEHGQVRVELERLGPDMLRFAVVDTGVGFDSASKPRLFERFQQADGSITRKFGGTGLGLSISRHLVELMQGSLDCDSVAGAGSTFWFDIPLAPAAGPETSCLVEAPGVSSASLRVLVADDHPTNRKVVELILAGANFEVTAVENGREAVEAAGAGSFDVVLMDMHMPVMDGLAAVRELRRRNIRRHGRPLPILMLTANALPEHIAAGRAAGADGHLTKPIKPAELLASIIGALEPRQPARVAELTA